MNRYSVEFKEFKILDEKDKLLATLDNPEEVEQFFDVLDEHVTQNYMIEGLDAMGYILDTWYMPDVISGNFKDDVEKAKKKNRSI